MNKRQCKKIASRPLTERKWVGDRLFWMLPKEWNHPHMQRWFQKYFRQFATSDKHMAGYHVGQDFVELHLPYRVAIPTSTPPQPDGAT